MSLIKDGKLSENTLSLIADDQALDGVDTGIVSLERWLELSNTAQFGVLLPNTVDVNEIWPQIKNASVIALEFPAFADGRAYSQARVLREQKKFSGEIRATGQAVVRDQLHFMQRCGINAFELREDQDADACIKALTVDFSTAYQSATDSIQPIYVRRR